MAKGGDKAKVGTDTLGAAVKELHAQHPIKYDSLGPHQSGTRHDRHEPLHGMHPKSRHGR